MKIPKPSDNDKEYFREIVADLPGVEVKPMFGNVAAFVNGNMFCGLFGDAVGVRLDEAGREELLAIPGAGPFGPDDRPMKEYVSLPSAWRADGDDELVDTWIGRALAHTRKLPAKKAKAKTKKATR